MREWTKEERYRVLKSPDEIKPLHDRIVLSPYRQTFHIQPVTGLLNDPNGFVHHNGKWHLFYQWCPWGAVHGLKYWYHTVSTDLIHWTNEGVCIKPDMEFDNKGAYSGSALLGPDAICFFYTGNHRDEDWTRKSYVCVVKMYDDGRYSKLPWPLFGPSDLYTEHQRDPKIIYNEELKTYFILIGAQRKDKTGTVIVYKSDKLLDHWEFAGELNVPGFREFGTMWECPSVERIGDKDVLILCPQHMKLYHRSDADNHNGYLIGSMDWESLTFTPDGSFHVLDFGFDSYAAECAANLKTTEKAVLVAWMGLPDCTYPTDEEDWSGCLTLPRELTIRDRRLIQKPLEELKQLRGDQVDIDGRLPDVCEMEFVLPRDAADRDQTFAFFTKADGTGGIHISYTAEDRMVTVDRSGLNRSINPQEGHTREHALDHLLSRLRVFIDKSSIEIFINEGDAVFTSRVFPTADEHYWAADSDTDCRIWKLNPAVKDNFIV